MTGSVNPAIHYLKDDVNRKETVIDDINNWLGGGGEEAVRDGLASGEIEEGRLGFIGLKGKLGSLAKDYRIEKDLPARVKSALETTKKRWHDEAIVAYQIVLKIPKMPEIDVLTITDSNTADLPPENRKVLVHVEDVSKKTDNSGEPKLTLHSFSTR